MNVEPTERRFPFWQASIHAILVGGVTTLLAYTIGYVGWTLDKLEQLRIVEKTLPRLNTSLLEVRSAQKSHAAFLGEIERLDLEYRKIRTTYFPEDPEPFLEALVSIAAEAGLGHVSSAWHPGSATTRGLSLKVSSMSGLPPVIDFLRSVQLSELPARIDRIELEGGLIASSGEMLAELSITFSSLPSRDDPSSKM